MAKEMNMSEEFDVYLYCPIKWGWLKILGIFSLTLAWLMLVGWFLQIIVYPTEGRDPLFPLVLSAVAGYLVLLPFGAKKAWGFICRYAQRNVAGMVVNFAVRDGEVDVWFGQELSNGLWQEGRLVWRVPLGGWFKGEPKLLIFRNRWVRARWNLRLVYEYWYPVPQLNKLKVQLVDRYQNALEVRLMDALCYVSNHEDQSLGSLLGDYESLILRLDKEARIAEAVGAQANSLLESFPTRHRRFANSENGKAFLAELAGILHPLTSRIR